MSTNQPGKPKLRFIDEAGAEISSDTTEGHAIRGKGGFEEADTEGHTLKFRPEDESVNRDIDSTEAHIVRFRPEDDSTEGHGARLKP